MASLLVLYKKPTDSAAFDDYYASTHVPLVHKIPGLKGFKISNGQVATPTGPAEIHLVAELEFASVAELMSALGSPEGQAAAGDLSNFADGGADLLIFDTREP